MADPRPCLVLVHGEWLPGVVLAWRHGSGGWRGLVRYRAPLRRVPFTAAAIRHEAGERCVVTYEHWRPARELKAGGP